ncbi:MAG: HEAT repeat domain-containing protein [Planctomycetales bacterium]|nr:HEAT repeat domain-containing protein [Planctomycetales bacterium]
MPPGGVKDPGGLGPTGPTAPRRPGNSRASPAETRWEEWWFLNRHAYARVERKGVAEKTGPGGPTPFLATPLGAFLLQELRGPAGIVRAAAALAIGKAGEPTLAPLLLPLLEDPDPEVRESALLAMGLSRASAVVPQILAVAQDRVRREPRLRAAAALAAGLSGDRAAAAGLAALLERTGEEAEVRGAAALALGLLRDPAGAPALLRAAAREGEEASVRAYAIAGIGHAGRDGAASLGGEARLAEARALLARLLSADRAEDVRRAAVLALGAIGDARDLGTVRRAVASDRDRMVERFGRLAAARLARGPAGAAPAPEAAEVRAECVKALSTLGNHEGRGFAAMALGVLGDPAAGTPLRQSLLSEEDPSLRGAAAIALGLLREKTAIGDLLRLAESPGEPTLRAMAAVALGLGGEATSLPRLQKLLESSTLPEVRAAAALALGLSGARGTAAGLLPVLEEKNSYLRLSTILAIGALRDEAAVGPLITRFKAETDPETRALILVALGHIADRSDRPVLPSVAEWMNYLVHTPAVDTAIRLY